MMYLGIAIAVAIIGLFGYVFYRRVVKGEGADFKKRDENGRIINK